MKIRTLEGLWKAANAGRNVERTDGRRILSMRTPSARLCLLLPGWKIRSLLRAGVVIVPLRSRQAAQAESNPNEKGVQADLPHEG